VVAEQLARLVHARDPARAVGIWESGLDGSPWSVRSRLRLAALLEESEDLDGALASYRSARDAGWLTAAERREIRFAVEDLEDMIRQREEEAEEE
jgi:hypothetical protein